METEVKVKKKNFWYWTRKVLLYGFALTGFGIVSAWAVFNLGLTKNGGKVDKNNRYLMEIGQMKQEQLSDSAAYSAQRGWDFYRIMCISKFYPMNANLILDALNNSGNITAAHQMISAIELCIRRDEKMQQEYDNMLQKGQDICAMVKNPSHTNNAFAWMNTDEWEVLKVALGKEKSCIDSAAKAIGIEPRLIVAVIIGEQIRLYHTNRETYKSYLGPVKVLLVETQFSLGVTGIKDFTAQRVEQNLKNPNSEFYLSTKYENLLDFKTGNVTAERYSRLTNNKNKYYSYLYAGLILRQVHQQWKNAGYDISGNAGILATLFNLGFTASVPKPNPEVGGANINIEGKPYTFGGLAFEFYYSGELSKEFPYYTTKFENS